MSKDPEHTSLDDLAPFPGGQRAPLEPFPPEAYEQEAEEKPSAEEEPSEEIPEEEEPEEEEPEAEEEPSEEEPAEEEEEEPPADEEEPEEPGEVDAKATVPGVRYNQTYGKWKEAERLATVADTQRTIADDRAQRAAAKVQEWQEYEAVVGPQRKVLATEHTQLTGQVAALTGERDILKETLDAIKAEHGIEDNDPVLQRVAMRSITHGLKDEILSSIQPSLDAIKAANTAEEQRTVQAGRTAQEAAAKTQFESAFAPSFKRHPKLREFEDVLMSRWMQDANAMPAQVAKPFVDLLLTRTEKHRRANVGHQKTPGLPKGGSSRGVPKKKKVRSLADADSVARRMLEKG